VRRVQGVEVHAEGLQDLAMYRSQVPTAGIDPRGATRSHTNGSSSSCSGYALRRTSSSALRHPGRPRGGMPSCVMPVSFSLARSQRYTNPPGFRRQEQRAPATFASGFASARPEARW